jgi:hypothetical protein
MTTENSVSVLEEILGELHLDESIVLLDPTSSTVSIAALSVLLDAVSSNVSLEIESLCKTPSAASSDLLDFPSKYLLATVSETVFNIVKKIEKDYQLNRVFLEILVEIYYSTISIDTLSNILKMHPELINKVLNQSDLEYFKKSSDIIYLHRRKNRLREHVLCSSIISNISKIFDLSNCTLLKAAAISKLTKFTPLYDPRMESELIFKELLVQEDNINNCRDDTETALIFACRSGIFERVELLIRKGADPNLRTSKTTALIEAAFIGSHKICIFLVLNGANLRARDQYGYTALDRFGRHMGGKLKFRKSERKAIFKNLTSIYHQKNWDRRWPFMKILFGHGFQDLASKQKQDKENVQSLIDNNVKLESISIATPQQIYAFLLH